MLDVRGPFETAYGCGSECILCAVDFAPIRWFGAFAPLRRVPERRRKQISDVAQWLERMLPHTLVVLDERVCTPTYLEQILERIQLDEIRAERPIAVHRIMLSPSTGRVVAPAQLEDCCEDLAKHFSGAPLLERIQRLNRLDWRLAALTATRPEATAELQSLMNSLLAISTARTRTLVLGDWLLLAAVRRCLQQRCARAPVTHSIDLAY